MLYLSHLHTRLCYTSPISIPAYQAVSHLPHLHTRLCYISPISILAQLRFNMLNHYYSDLTTIFNTNRLTTIVNFGQATGRISRGDMPHTSGVT